jgi:hypothetical protein
MYYFSVNTTSPAMPLPSESCTYQHYPSRKYISLCSSVCIAIMFRFQVLAASMSSITHDSHTYASQAVCSTIWRAGPSPIVSILSCLPVRVGMRSMYVGHSFHLADILPCRCQRSLQHKAQKKPVIEIASGGFEA